MILGLYCSSKIGSEEKVRNFRCYKFRTMVIGAEWIGNGLIVTANDDRITRVGRWLRKWTLDEIPQLLNVLRGDMSIVGPRPWVPTEAAFCGPEESRRFDFRPEWPAGRGSMAETWSPGMSAFGWTFGTLTTGHSDWTPTFSPKLSCYCSSDRGVYGPGEQRAGSMERGAKS